MTAAVEISIILEWENVLLSEEDRCFLMLRQLKDQLMSLQRSAELIVLFNPKQVDREQIAGALHENLGTLAPGMVRLEEAEDTHYFQLKNEGAKRARGEILVFVDSDVLIEEGWLHEISEPLFEHSEILVVGGNTWLTHDSLYEKSFALGWFFPFRDTEGVLKVGRQHFFANNVAFRRDLLLQYPFPEMPPGVTRGACNKLARILSRAGIPIWNNGAARASHPPPVGLNTYTIRGLAIGRDLVLREGRSPLTFFRCIWWWLKRTVRATGRILIKARMVGLPLWQTPAAVAIMVLFYSLAFVGGVVALVAPGYAAKHWQI